ncbi:glycosyltransferase family 4 protein [Neorhizobium petrolearium]|uniref:glycosyltransferase family 4 protein n=1 Tax=Neorhizobium petrolearium TaxID=515361 RepID=UPI003F16065A
MIRQAQTRSPRVLMTVDAVGGVWRYAMDLAGGLKHHGVRTCFAGFGPRPSREQILEAEALGELVWFDAPLDWMVDGEAALQEVPRLLSSLARQKKVDLLHLNLPSQAAGLDVPMPVVVVSHSCVVTWFAGVRGSAVPEGWRWQQRVNREGFERADVVLAPSHSYAAMMEAAYGPISNLKVIYNASRLENAAGPKQEFVFAAARWWDDGKNGVMLDAAAASVRWPVVMAGANRGPNGQYLALRNADYRGELSHRRAMVLMRQAAVVASPSVYEPFGLAPLEAARAGAALALSDIPTYRELWEGAALFADPRDPGAFADALNLLAGDDGQRAVLAVKAYERSKMFGVEVQAAAVNHIYSGLLHQGHTLTAAE